MFLKRFLAVLLPLAAFCTAGCSSSDETSVTAPTPTETASTQLVMTGSAQVTVTETGSGAPVSGATVRLGDAAAVTGADGSCAISRVQPGARRIFITKPGYRPTSGSIQVGEGAPISNALTITRAAGAARYDVVVVGAGTGGVSAAIQAARMGMRVALLEETDWIGGQMTAAAVTSLDEGNFLKKGNRSGIYREFFEKVKAHYAARGKSTGTAYFTPGSTAFEPSIGQKILYRMLPEGGAASAPFLDLYLRARVLRTISTGNAVTGVVLGDGSTLESKVTIDATEYGDILPLAGARYRVGNSTSDAINPAAKLNPLTWTAVIRKYPGQMDQQLLVPAPPPGYEGMLTRLRAWVTMDGGRGDLWYQGGPLDPSSPFSFAFHNAWRGMPDSGNPENYDASGAFYTGITKTGINAGTNDYPATARYLEDPLHRKQVNCAAKLRTLQALYYMQSEVGANDWSVATDEEYDTPYSREESACPDLPPEFAQVERHFPVIPYVRESRRAIGIMTLTARDTRRDGTVALKNFPSSLAVGDYPYDIHGGVRTQELDCGDTAEDVVKEWSKAGGSFQVPFETFIPETVDGLLMAEKNLSASRLVTSAIRLQPITMMTGQAAGALAALAVQQGVQPREVKPVDVQWKLLEAGCALALYNPRDVPFSHPYWKQVQLALLYGMQPGGVTFNPEGTMWRSELAGVVGSAFGVAPEAANPATPATRADLAVLVASAMKLDLSRAPTAPVYPDVPGSHRAFRQIQLLHQLGVFGAPVASRQFEPEGEVTRGEIAFMIVNAALAAPNSVLNTLPLQRGTARGTTGAPAVNGGATAAATAVASTFGSP